MTPPDAPRLEAALRDAMGAFQRGDFAAAVRSADHALTLEAGNYDAAHVRALATLYGGDAAAALPMAQELVARFADDAYVFNTLGAALQVLGRLDEAAAAYGEAAARAPQYAEAWLNRGLLLSAKGRHAEAAPCFDAAIRAGRADAPVYELLGVALLNSGQAAAGEKALRQADARAPSNAGVLSNLATALLLQGRAADALNAAQRAVGLDGRHAPARDNLATALRMVGRPGEAERVAEEGGRLGVATPRTALLLALARMDTANHDGALAPAREAARLAPGSAEAAGVAGLAELQATHLEAALERFAEARALEPRAARWRFLAALALPPIMASKAQIALRLAQMDAAWDDLIESPPPIADPMAEVGLTPFYLAYQGVDDTALQRKAAKAMRLAAPSLEWVAPHLNRPRDAAKRIRIGILSAHLRDHTIGKLNIGFVHKIDRERFEVIVLRPAAPPDALSGFFDQAADGVVTLPPNLAGARQAVAAAELDALFYPDIGMDPFTYYLAFARLARIQFTTWGHPVTTGIPNIDFFLSSRHAEPQDAQRFYSEKLVAFESLPSFYYRPRPPSQFDVRAHLGMDAGQRLYACPQTLFKFHPDFDLALLEILRRDPKAKLLLIASRNESWNQRMRERLRAADAATAERILLVPSLPLPDFLALAQSVDALLDTFHFGGGNSSYEALSMSSPVVTLPARMMRGRVTAAWYSAMGQSRWVARSAQQFVELALELAEGGDRERWRAEVAEGAGQLLENEAVVRELETFVERVLSGSAPGG